MTTTTPATVSRRGLLRGAAATAAVAALGLGPRGRPVCAQGAPTPAASSAFGGRPLHYPLAVGELEGVVLSDGVVRLGPVGGQVVPNATDEEIAPLLREHFLPTGQLVAALNTFLLRAGGKTILFDVGYGDESAGEAGRQHRALAAAGVDPATVDIVAISHCHPDHLWGLADAAGAPSFPNAEVVLHEKEFAFWGDPSHAVPALQGLFDGFERNLGPLRDRVRTLGDGDEIVPGVTLVPAAGHTPGHSAFLVESGGDRLLLTCDTANHAVLFLRRPDFHFGFDFDKPAAVATRRRLLGRAADEELLVLGYHFPFPGVGHVVREGAEGFRFVARPWEL